MSKLMIAYDYTRVRNNGEIEHVADADIIEFNGDLFTEDDISAWCSNKVTELSNNLSDSIIFL